MHEVFITGNTQVADCSYILSFKRFFNFSPGQVINIYFGKEYIQRIYSIVSGINNDDVKILYKVKPGGLVTPSLALLNTGDKINVSLPYGVFTNFSDNAVFIATGTGIAPFASLLFSGKWQNQMVIHGSGKSNEFYFSNYFNNLINNYVRCCTGEKTGNFYNGRVIDYLRNEALTDKNIMYYLCGKAEMVTDVRDLLISKGVPFGNIITEIYF